MGKMSNLHRGFPTRRILEPSAALRVADPRTFRLEDETERMVKLTFDLIPGLVGYGF